MTMFDISSLDPLLLERARKIRVLALDVDGVLTDGRLYYDEAGNESKAFYTRDGLGIKALQRNGFDIALITGRESRLVSRRARELGIELVFQGQDFKVQAFEDVLQQTGASAEQVCYAGDDWVDLPLLDRAGLAVAVADADDWVKQRAHWVTGRPGGRGAVREICNLILVAQGLDQAARDHYQPS